jgi:hypothetical protein
MNETVCPYLGRADDRDTAFAFASPGHMCFRLEQTSPITLSHQTTYCLVENYSTCPVYRLAHTMDATGGGSTRLPSQSTPLKQNAAGKSFFEQWHITPRMTAWLEKFARPFQQWLYKTFRIDTTQNPATPLIFITLVAILVISVLFFLVVALTYLTTPVEQKNADFQATIQASNQPEIRLVTLTPTLRSAFIQKMGFAGVSQGYLLVPFDTPEPEPSPITIVVTPTEQPTETGETYYACGAPSDWVPYIVQAGDSLTALSVEYDVALFELSSNNCLGITDNLLLGQQIYVPGN